MIKNSIVEFADKNCQTYEQVLKELDAYMTTNAIEEFIKHYTRMYDLNYEEED